MSFKEKIATAFLALPSRKDDTGVSPVIVKFYGVLPTIDKMEAIVSFVGLSQGCTYYVDAGIYFNEMPCYLNIDEDGTLNKPKEFIALNEGFDKDSVPMIFNIPFEAVGIENYGVHKIKVTLYNSKHELVDVNSYYFEVVQGLNI